MGNAEPIICMRAVDKWFGPLHVLRHIDLEISAGQRVVLCGPSGSGKSTLVYCLNGLEDYDAGEIRIKNVPVSDREGTAHFLRRSVGMVFQQFNLFGHMTILENCVLGPRRVLGLSRKAALERAYAELERVRIADQAHKSPSQLSGGQQQRAAIARALCMKPEVMLFDEPTSALDPEMVKEVLDVMIELASGGMTMICVTHEMGFARQAADRIVMMDSGSIIEDLPPAAFFSSGRANPRVKAFLDQILV